MPAATDRIAQRADALHELSELALAPVDLPTLLLRAAAIARTALSADGARIFETHAPGTDPPSPAFTEGIAVPLDDEFARRVIDAPQPIVVPNLAAERALAASPLRSASSIHIGTLDGDTTLAPTPRSAVFAPIPGPTGGPPVGILALYFSEPRALDNADLRCCTTLANLLAASLRRNAPVTVVIPKGNPFRILWDTTIGAAFFVDLESRVVLANEAASNLTGYSHQELRGKRLIELAPPEDWPLILERVRRINSGETISSRFERRVIRKDGTTLWVEATTRGVLSDDGSVVGRVSEFRDISDRRRAETALRQSDERLSTLVDNAPVGLYQLDINGVYTAAEGSLPVRGLSTPSDVVGLNFFDHNADQTELIAAAKRALAGQPADAILDRDTFVRHAHFRPIRDADGNVTGAIIASVDITERARAEQALRESEARLAVLVGNAPVGLFQTDADGIYTLAEGNLRLGDGIEPSELIGRSIFEHNRDFPEALNAIKHALAGDPATATITRDGFVRQVRYQPLRGPDGAVIGLITATFDITDRARAEHDMRQSEQLLDALVSNTPVGLYQTDADGVITLARGSLFIAAGADAATVVGKNVFDAADRWPQIGAAVKQALAGQPATASFGDGESTRHAGYQPLRDADGVVTGMIVASFDITERARAETALRTSEANLALAQRIAHIGSFDHDLRTDKRTWSIEQYRILGLDPTAGDDESDTLWRLIHPEDRESVATAVEHTRTTGAPYDIEYRVIRPDGAERLIHARGELVSADNADPGHLVGTVQDITEPRQAENALRESEQRLDALVSNAPIGLYQTDADGIVTLARGSLFLEDGADAASLVGKNIFHTTRSRPQVGAAVKQALAGQPATATIADGKIVRAARYQPLRDAAGNVTGMIAASIDITERAHAEAALRHSEEQLRAVIDHAPVTMVALDADGTFTLGRGSLISESGSDARSLVGQNIFDQPDQPPEVVDAVRRALGGELATATVARHGAVHTGRYQPIRADDGVITGVIGVAFDITDRVQAEIALRESEERWRRVSDLAADGIAIVDDDFRFIYVNDAMCDLLGRSRDQILHHRSVEFIGPRTIDRISGYRHALRRRGIAHHVIDYQRPDGSIVVTDAHTVALGDGSYQAIIRDVTAIRAAEDALRQSEATLARAQAVAQVGSWELDLRTGRRTWSDQNFRTFGVDPESQGDLDAVFAAGVHPDDRDMLATKRQETLDGEGATSYDFRFIRPDGRERIITTSYVVERDDDGQPMRLVGTSHDVTDQRAAEAKAAQVERLDSIGRLAGGMAHDFNNLLGVIIANLDIAALHAAPGATDAIAQAKAAATDAADVTAQLLAIGRASAGPREPRALAPLVTDVLSILERSFAGRVVVQCEISADLVVLADAARLKQVILNLAINAGDAMPHGGQLNVRARPVAGLPDDVPLPPRDDGYVLIQVHDTGDGMDAETKARFFDPFFTTKGDVGTGLGGAVVYGIVREHEGIVTVDSKPGLGATINVYLPAATLNAHDPVQGNRSTAPARTATVLVVDDMEPLRRVTQGILETIGCSTLAAADGEEALDILRTDPDAIDLVVLDCTLPGLSGRGVYDALRHSGHTASVLFISGYTTDALAGLDVAADWSFLAKPFDSQSLADAVRALLGPEHHAA